MKPDDPTPFLCLLATIAIIVLIAHQNRRHCLALEELAALRAEARLAVSTDDHRCPPKPN